jgi:ribosomal protein S27E
MQVRCQRCGNMFTLSREAVATALEEVKETQAEHYNVECTKCRRQIKVPVKRLLRSQPRED